MRKDHLQYCTGHSAGVIKPWEPTPKIALLAINIRTAPKTFQGSAMILDRVEISIGQTLLVRTLHLPI
jgi:hypothetical protein